MILLRGATQCIAFVIVATIAITAVDVSPAAAICTTGDTQDVRRSGGDVTGSVSSGSGCPGGGGGGPSPAGRWAAYCSAFGDWLPTNTVDLIRGEEVEEGTPTNAGDATQPVTAPGPATRSFRWSIQCTGPLGFFEYSTTLPAGAAPVDPIAVRNEALAKLTIPDPELGGSPPLDDPDRFSVVHIPTWLWITHPWQPLDASASDGGVSVTVFATPIEVIWDPGDGEAAFDCPDAGTPWQLGLDDSIGCTHTYTESSAGQPGDAYELSATVVWSLTWTVNGTDLGQFDVYEPSLTISHQVGEIQAIEKASS